MRHDSKGRAEKEVTVGFLHFLSSSPQPWRRQRLLFGLLTTSLASLHCDSRLGFHCYSSCPTMVLWGPRKRRCLIQALLAALHLGPVSCMWPGPVAACSALTTRPCPALPQPAPSPPPSPPPSLPRRRCWPGWLAFLWYLFHGMVFAPPLSTSLSLPAWPRLADLTRETAKQREG